MAGTEVDLASWRGGMSGWDKRLLEVAARRSGKISPDELAALAGGTAASAGQRLKELLASRDWLSQIELQGLVLEDLINLKDHLAQMMEDGGEHYDSNGRYRGEDPRWAAELLKTIKEISRQYELGLKGLESAKTQIRHSHADLMVKALELTFTDLLGRISADHPEVDEIEYQAVLVRDVLPRAFEIIEDATRDPEEEAAA